LLETDDRIAPWLKGRIAESIASGYEKAGNTAEAAAWRAKRKR
jgi:hypothetical protein